MPNLTRAPRAALTKAKPRSRRRSRGRRRRISWWTAIKIAFMLQRFRRRRSSPSLRQIALAAVSAGLAIVVIRALSRQTRRAGGPEPQAPSAPAPPSGDGLANARSLTDRVQSEMARRADAPSPATGTE